MFRKALHDLILWANKEHSKPLVLRGARQVGKSTLVRMLSKELDRDLVEVNLEKNIIRELNNQSDFSIEKVITEIQIITKKQITDTSILFLDEIQAQPLALNSLRYFYEDKPKIKIIAAGSLLEAVIHREDFRMPVGRIDYYYLGPMTFSEFLKAMGEEILLKEIEKINLSFPPSKTLHQKAIQQLKGYYFVGGMPEAVKTYAKHRDHLEVRNVHHSLIQTYRDDIPKYSKGSEQGNISNVFNFTPSNLGKKVIYSQISNKHSSYIKKAITLLAMANVIYKTCHNRCSGLPLKAGEDCDVMKLYFLDIGLYNAMMEIEWSDLYQLNPDELITKGNMAEQFVAQHLAFRNPKKELSSLYYWLRGGKKGAAEVDFVFSEQSKIYPLEVKSGNSGKMRSLWQFVAEKKTATALRLDLSLRKQLISSVKHNVKTANGIESISCQLIGLPLYTIENLTPIVREYVSGN